MSTSSEKAPVLWTANSRRLGPIARVVQWASQLFFTLPVGWTTWMLQVSRRVDTELYVKPLRIAIYRESRSLKMVDGARTDEILTNIVRALAFLGHPTEIV
jgi:hypothetical protein